MPSGPRPADPAGASRLWPLYLGGFMGPFGGAMVSTMLPELARGLDTTVAMASVAVTAYMLPFSVVMVFSGTLGARWGLARSIRVAFVAFAAASLLCVAARDPVVFLIGRGLQGTANAFTTPLLLAAIHQLVPASRLGRALGSYSSVGAAGQAFALLFGGLAAGVDYRWAFVANAVVGLALAALVGGWREQRGRDAPSWRPLANRELARAAVIAFAVQLGATGTMLLTALVASDRFGMPPAARGLVVAVFGVAGLLTGRVSGRIFDVVGTVRAGLWSAVSLALGVTAVGVAPWAFWLIAGVVVAGAAAAGTRVLVNALALHSTPANPAGATSIALAVQFVGAAVAPAVLPVYHVSPIGAALVVAVVCLIGAGLARRPQPAVSGGG